MELLVGIGWILIGVFYLLYRYGSEKLEGGVTGGIALIGGVIGFFLYLAIAYAIGKEMSNGDEAFFVLGAIACPALLMSIWARTSDKEDKEILEILKRLPAPSEQQMKMFAEDTILWVSPSIKLRERYYDADSPEKSTALFKIMQSGWLYYSKHPRRFLGSRWMYFNRKDLLNTCTYFRLDYGGEKK